MRLSMVLAAVAGVLAGGTSAPVSAQIFHDDDDGWCLWCFHRYGGDVNRPGATFDRPYWHGDDAVPLGLRWHDVEAARAEAAEADAIAATAVAAPAAVLARRRPVVHRRRHAHPQAKDCVPVLVRKD